MLTPPRINWYNNTHQELITLCKFTIMILMQRKSYKTITNITAMFRSVEVKVSSILANVYNTLYWNDCPKTVTYEYGELIVCFSWVRAPSFKVNISVHEDSVSPK